MLRFIHIIQEESRKWSRGRKAERWTESKYENGRHQSTPVKSQLVRKAKTATPSETGLTRDTGRQVPLRISGLATAKSKEWVGHLRTEREIFYNDKR